MAFDNTLGQIIAQVESGNNPNASATDAFGNVSSNILFQQSPGFIQQFGAGNAGVTNLAQQVLAGNPNATLGDFYAAYNSGFNTSTLTSSIPFSSYLNGTVLNNGVSLGANLNNLNRGASLSGANSSTPLSSLLSGGTGGGTVDDQFSDLTGQTPNELAPDSGSALGNLGFGAETSPDVTSAAGSADFDDLPDNIFDGSTDPISTVAGGATTAATGAAGAGGLAVTVTDLPGLDSSVTGAGKAVQTGAGTIGSSVTGAAGTVTGTVASAINSLETYTSSTFVAVAIAIMGIIFVAFGLGFFKPKQVLNII
jgi:hypothetical protein